MPCGTYHVAPCVRPMTLLVAHVIACLMWHILWSRCPMAQAHPTLCIHHPSSIASQRKSQRLQSEIAIWRFRDFKIVKSWDCEIYRLQDLEIATSEIVKCVDCEYCGVWRMRVSQKNDIFIRFTQSHLAISHGSRRIWAMTKCRLDIIESLNTVLTEIKSDKRTCKKQYSWSWSQVTQTYPTKHLQSRKWVDT